MSYMKYYEYEALIVYQTNLYSAIYVEAKLISAHKAYRYTPAKYIIGHTECFTKYLEEEMHNAQKTNTHDGANI